MMSDLSDILSDKAVDADLVAANKKALFQQLASAAAKLTGLSAKEIAASLNAREKIGSTGFGGGAAIPHGKLEGLPAVFGYFARLETPIDFQSIDGMPVDLVFLLLSPPDAGADHLKALARVSRAFRDTQVVAKLRGARSRDAIYALLAARPRIFARSNRSTGRPRSTAFSNPRSTSRSPASRESASRSCRPASTPPAPPMARSISR
jgi:PTS system nitrogen regulatory IIA component